MKMVTHESTSPQRIDSSLETLRHIRVLKQSIEPVFQSVPSQSVCSLNDKSNDTGSSSCILLPSNDAVRMLPAKPREFTTQFLLGIQVSWPLIGRLFRGKKKENHSSITYRSPSLNWIFELSQHELYYFILPRFIAAR